MVLLGAALAASAAALAASAAPVSSGAPVLVELFTSEGCSSCPPAERLLAHLAADQPVPGALVVPLALHVDYWNHLGWTDPFSSARFTKRQTAYAARFGNADNVYTPQMVVNGRIEFVGSDEQAARRAIEAEASEPHASVRVLPDASGALRISVAGSSPAADVLLVVIEDNLVSDVTRGENSGQRLTHTAVARDFVKAGRVDAAGRFDSAVSITPGKAMRRVLAIVQERGVGRVLGVSTPVDLPSPAIEGRSISGRESPD
jgi:hypothetical protein